MVAMDAVVFPLLYFLWFLILTALFTQYVIRAILWGLWKFIRCSEVC